MIRIVAVSGRKDSGKTTLCRKLIKELSDMGIRTGYIKRTAEDVISKRTQIPAQSPIWG